MPSAGVESPPVDLADDLICFFDRRGEDPDPAERAPVGGAVEYHCGDCHRLRFHEPVTAPATISAIAAPARTLTRRPPKSVRASVERRGVM